MKIIKFTNNTTGEISYFEGTFSYTSKLGDLERYSDVGISWCNEPSSAKHLNDYDAEKYISDWKEIFVGSTIEAVSVS